MKDLDVRQQKSFDMNGKCVNLGQLLLVASAGVLLSSGDRLPAAFAQELIPASEQAGSTGEPLQSTQQNPSNAAQHLAPGHNGIPFATEAPTFSDSTDDTIEVSGAAELAQSGELPAEVAEALKVPARFNLDHQSSSLGFDGMTSFGGFIPLDQTPGENITFIEGDLLLENDGDLGWSIDLGHRGFDGDIARIRGGYIGFDGRSTDESTFYQMAAGYERLAEDWDFRLNGYVPLGQSLNTFDSSSSESIVEPTSGFQNNQLVLSSVNERRRIRQEEEALGGFDAEIATQLSEWDGGELTGAAGGYWLSGENSSWGGQLRLAANFKSNFRAGVALQHDGIFGTNFVVSIGASWPKIRFQKDEEEEFQETYEIPIRLRDSIHRRETVPVERRTDVEITRETVTEALRNPEEGNEADGFGTYRFVHVALDGAAGDGTYEAPFNTVADAVAFVNANPDPDNNANTIIYVDGEIAAAGTTIPGFTIPDQARVLSQGPQQFIAGRTFTGFTANPVRLPFDTEDFLNVDVANNPDAVGIRVPLPDSGDGVFPTISGGSSPDLVTLGEDTILAGFNIDGASQNGVAGSNIRNVELRNNRITGSGENGIFLDDVGGSVVLFDNEITGSADRGIFAQNTTSLQSVDITIAGYQLADNRVGMEFATTSNTVTRDFPAQNIAVTPSNASNTSVGLPGGTALNNSILNSTAEGVIVSAAGNVLGSSSSQEFLFDQGRVEGSGATGISATANVGAHAQEINITNSTIANNAGDGLATVVGTPPSGATVTASTQEFVVRNSIISGNGGAGININLADASSQELVIRGNQILNNTGDGISSLAQNTTIQEWRNDVAAGDVGASENVITGNGGQGIDIDAQNLASLPVVGIADNTINSNGLTPDLDIATTSSPANLGSPTTCAVIRGNNVGNSIQLTGLTTASTGGLSSFQVQDIANVIAANNNALIVFASNTTTPDTAPFENENGSCID